MPLLLPVTTAMRFVSAMIDLLRKET